MGLVKVDFYLLQAPADVPVKTSFGIMDMRPALLVRLEDSDGVYGWGEIWCNHPPMTGHARLSLATEIVAPMLKGDPEIAASACLDYLEKKTRVLTLQCGEPGPYAQVIAGLETAFWDMSARKADKSLQDFLGGAGMQSVPAYASGINPDGAPETIACAREAGFNTFKIKIGFSDEADLKAVSAAAKTLQEGERIMLDANQGWQLEQALHMCGRLAEFAPLWIEEPLAVNASVVDWQTLAKASPVPLAGGENIIGLNSFHEIIGAGYLQFIQPDVAKWGGINGCLAAGRAALAAKQTYCPHFLGAAPGLFASAHLLAVAGGGGLLEVDINANMLRTDLSLDRLQIEDGRYVIPNTSGIGFRPNNEVLDEFLVDTTSVEI